MAATYGFQRIKILSMEEQPLHFCTENLPVSTTTMSSFPSLSRSGGLADRSLVRVPWPLGPAFWPEPCRKQSLCGCQPFIYTHSCLKLN